MRWVGCYLLLAFGLTGCETATSSENAQGTSFGVGMVTAAQICHDHVWFNIPKFEKLPNAAISSFPGSENNGTYLIFWNVRWDDPETRAAGACEIAGGQIVAFEDYSEPR
ncbi:hypothetical protein [Sphingorhabdus sp. Alg231-15]|uniref:hypothetical protein n=1 Tax=Sphingorhabdus sp. Alg231-15 TaxID=1922222 RepID=UPI000D553A59